MTNLARILDGRLREAANDPSRYTPRRNSANDHQVEPLGEWVARAAISAIELAFGENDVTVITGERLHELENSPPADPRSDAGLLAFIVRDLMAAASYHYDPTRPLTDQAHECADLIRNTRHEWLLHVKARDMLKQQHEAEAQRLTDLVAELRKQLASALALAKRHGARIEPWDYPENNPACADPPPAVLGDIEETTHD